VEPTCLDEDQRPMNQGGQLKAEYRATWANYFVRYIEEYRKRGVNIWGVTVQNEPAGL